ncbi:MAG: hypothetical protein QF704_11330 [Anaerolineales bacterium]|nr:hypothetical protein [Anaerolineales bacterium]
MNRFWIKLYISTLSDVTLAQIDDQETHEHSAWRFFVECLLVCGQQSSNEGWLPSVEGLAWLLRRSEDNVSYLLERLENGGLVKEYKKGYRIAKFEKYQAPVPAKMRKAAQRASELNNNSKELINALK